jgi:hypothetical protein
MLGLQALNSPGCFFRQHICHPHVDGVLGSLDLNSIDFNLQSVLEVVDYFPECNLNFFVNLEWRMMKDGRDRTLNLQILTGETNFPLKISS